MTDTPPAGGSGPQSEAARASSAESASVTAADAAPGQLSLARLARLSDIVYAAALLILLATFTFASGEPTTSEEAWAFLAQEFDAWINFAISFLIIAYYWISHQAYFSYYRRTNKTHTMLELVYLMLLAVMPFSNQHMGAHPDLFEPKVIVSVDIFVVGMMQFFIWWYATAKDRLVAPGVPDAATRSALRNGALIMPAIAVVAVVGGYFNVYIWDAVLIIGPIAVTVWQKLK